MRKNLKTDSKLSVLKFFTEESDQDSSYEFADIKQVNYYKLHENHIRFLPSRELTS